MVFLCSVENIEFDHFWCEQVWNSKRPISSIRHDCPKFMFSGNLTNPVYFIFNLEPVCSCVRWGSEARRKLHVNGLLRERKRTKKNQGNINKKPNKQNLAWSIDDISKLLEAAQLLQIFPEIQALERNPETRCCSQLRKNEAFFNNLKKGMTPGPQGMLGQANLLACLIQIVGIPWLASRHFLLLSLISD